MATLEELLVRIGIDDRDVDRAASNAERQFSRIARAGDRVGSLGRSLTDGLTKPLGAAAASAIQTAADFDKSMSVVEAVTGATAKELGMLEKAARDAAKGTSFTATEAADALAELGKTGFSATEAVSGLPPVLQLATAGQLEMAKAADIASTIMNTMGLEAKDLGQVTDALAKGATSSATNVDQMGFAFARSAAAAKAAGLNVNEATEAVALMAEAGFRGTAAGTGLNKILGALNTEGSKGADLFKKYGVELRDADGSMRRLSDITLDAKEAGVEYNDIIEAFGLNHGPKFASVLGLTDDKLRSVQSAMEDTEGAGAKMAATMEDNLQGAFKRLQSAWEEFQLTVMRDAGLSNALKVLVDLLAKILNKISELAKANIWITRAVIAFAALAAAVGPVLVVVGFLISQMTLAAAVIGTVLLGALAAVVVWLGSFAAAAVLAWKQSDEFRQKVTEGFGLVKDAAATLRGVFAELWRAVQRGVDMYRSLTQAADSFGETLTKTSDAGSGAIKAMDGLGDAVSDTLSRMKGLKDLSDDLTQAVTRVAFAFSSGGLTGALRQAKTELADLGPKFLAVIKEALGPLITWVGANAPKIIDAVLAIRQQLLDAALKLFGALVEALPRILPPLVAQMITLILQVVDFLLQAIPLVVEAALQLFTGLVTGLVQALPRIVESLQNLVRIIVDTLVMSLPLLIAGAVTLLTGLVTAIAQVLPIVLEGIVMLVEALLTTLIEQLPLLVDAGLRLLTALVDGILQALPLLIEVAMRLVPQLIEVVVEQRQKILETGSDLLVALIEGLVEMLPDLLELGRTLIPLLVEAAVEFLPVIIDAGIKILNALLEGLVKAQPQIMDFAIDIVFKVAAILIKNAPKITAAGLRLLGALLTGLIRALPRILVFVATLPFRIAGKVLGMAGQLFSAGARLIGRIAAGMLSNIGSVTGAAGRVAGAIRDYLPFSPAKRGPLSGAGDPQRSGASISANLAKGIIGGKPDVVRAAEAIARAAAVSFDIAPKARTGFGRAVDELRELVESGRFKKGGSLLFEDVSFQGMSKNFQKFHGDIADGFWRAVFEIEKAIKRGKMVFEDFTFQGMSKDVEKFGSTIAKLFHQSAVKRGASTLTKAFKPQDIFSMAGFANGGVVSKPMLGMVGEGGEKEAITPLSTLDEMLRDSVREALRGTDVEASVRPDVRSRMQAQRVEIVVSGPEELKRLIRKIDRTDGLVTREAAGV